MCGYSDTNECCADVRKWNVICRIFGICGKTVDLSYTLYRRKFGTL